MKLPRIFPNELYQRLRRLKWKYAEATKEKTFRQKEMFALVNRPQYAYGLLKAADITRYFGHASTTVCEFGVAGGAGLLNMIELAERITAETGVQFRVFGFDTGQGLTEIIGAKDHPEVWSKGDYPMMEPDELKKKIAGRAELVIGDIKNTIGPFLQEIDPIAPIGFLSIDVDIYSSAKNALHCLTGDSALYNPAVSMYFDDISHFFANDWCGELAAIHEFNSENDQRKIDLDRSQRHYGSKWFQRMYVCHILNHEARLTSDTERKTKIKAGGNLPAGVLN